MPRNYKEISYFLLSISKNAFFLFLISILSAFSSFVIGVLVSKHFGAYLFGEYVTAYNFYSMFYLFPLLGLGIFVIRELARDKTLVSKYFSNAGFIIFITSLICFFLICAIVYFMRYPISVKVATYIVGLSIIPNSFILFTRALFIVFAKVRYAFFATCAELAVQLIFSWIAIISNCGINSLMLIQVFSKLVGALLSIYFIVRFIKDFRLEIDFDFCRRILRGATFAFTLMVMLGSVLSKIDVVVLSSVGKIVEVGWYGPASRLVWFGYALITSIEVVFSPIASKLFVVSRELFEDSSRQFLKYLIAFTLPFLLIGFLASDRLILFFFGREFINSIIVFKILIWAIFFWLLFSFCDILLVAANKQRLIIYALSFFIIVSLILNIFLSYKLGCVGASIAVLFSAVICAFLELWLVYKFMFNLKLGAVLSKPLLSGAIMGLFMYLANQHINFWLLCGLSLAIYFFALLKLKIFTPEDRILLRKFQEQDLLSGIVVVDGNAT